MLSANIKKSLPLRGRFGGGLLLLLFCFLPASAAVTSPSGNLRLTVRCDKRAPQTVSIDLASKSGNLMQGITLGLTTSRRDFTRLRLLKAQSPKLTTTEYQMLQGKRLHIKTRSRDCRYTFLNAEGDTLHIDFRLSDDGLAFRYVTTAGSAEEKITAEATSYPIADGAKRWIAPYDVGYEQFFPQRTDGADVRKNQDGNWSYPALIELRDNAFALITESDILRDHCGSWLNNKADRNRYHLIYADKEQPAEGSWTSPWRLVVCGTLATIVESTLATDVASPSVAPSTPWVQPAPVSWIYWAHNHGSRELPLIKRYIDHAVSMKWPYMLIDAEWDQMTNGDSIEAAFSYARSRDVKPMIWYNSCTGWVDGPGPRWRLNKPEDRRREFEWLQRNGVVGIKVDFFGGDDILDMNYYHDILADALRCRLMVVLHGAVMPRGWQRTYPNLMTMEGVYGAEWYNNNGTLTSRAAAHNATLPFTRNVVGPMDYTPGTFSDSQHPHITSHAHELALPFLFESALQHMPDRPEAYAALPDEVRQTLSALPTVWDDTRLLSGYPAHHAVIARRSGSVWYIAGVNGTDSPLTLTADLALLPDFKDLLANSASLTLFADGREQREFSISHNSALCAQRSALYTVPCLPRGGFLAVIKGTETDG